MSIDKNVKPTITIDPGHTIKKYLDVRGWSQEELSQMIGLSTKQLSYIITNKARITIETARLLAKAFDNSPEFWINLDTTYRLNLEADKDKEENTQRKARIRKFMPVYEILKKGWYVEEKTPEGFESLYERVWDRDSADLSVYEKPEKLFCARQKNNDNQYTSYYSLTWQQIARQTARKIELLSYDINKLNLLAERFSEYIWLDDGIYRILDDLNTAGVCFFVLSPLSKTYIDGAAFFEGVNPVIVYTGRCNRFDNFWITIAHEISHVLLHLSDNKEFSFLDDMQDGKAVSKQEKEADHKAEELLKVDEIIKEAAPYLNYLSEEKLTEISEKLHIEMSVILGVLQHKGMVEYRKLNKYKKNVLEQIPERFIKG